MKMTLFKTMNAKALASADKFFIEGGAAKVALRFENWIANHVSKGFESGDTGHFDKVLAGGRSFHRFRWVKSVFCGINVGAEFALGLIPYEYNPATEKFEGKADSAKLEELRTMVEYKTTDDNIIMVPKWEKLLRMALDNEQAAEKKASKSEFKFNNRALKLVKDGRTHGHSEAQMKSGFDSAIQMTRPPALPEGRKSA